MDLEEKKYGLLAKEQVKFFLPEGTMQTLVTVKDKAGKFGRILGKFKIFDSKNDCETTINDWMIQEHHAAPYMGQSKDQIAQIHLDLHFSRMKLLPPIVSAGIESVQVDEW